MVEEVIWKYDISLERLSATAEPRIDMPIGARVISVGAQGNDLCIWAVVDPKAEKEVRQFSIYGTGHPVLGFKHPVLKQTDFLGTVQFEQYALVLHVFGS